MDTSIRHPIDWVTDKVAIATMDGGIAACEDPSCVVICVLGPDNPRAAIHFDLRTPPFEQDLLNQVAQAIQTVLDGGKKCVVHCASGVERSPLSVVWWLHTYRGLTVENAYVLATEKRPEAQDRQAWIIGLSEN